MFGSSFGLAVTDETGGLSSDSGCDPNDQTNDARTDEGSRTFPQLPELRQNILQDRTHLRGGEDNLYLVEPLREGEEADQHRYKREPAGQLDKSEGEPGESSNRIEADHGDEKSDPT